MKPFYGLGCTPMILTLRNVALVILRSRYFYYKEVLGSYALKLL